MCRCNKQNLVFIGLDDERERKVFNIISKKPINFTTIKNKAGFHQEITSRILSRLSDKAVIRKVDELYDMCCNGNKVKGGA